VAESIRCHPMVLLLVFLLLPWALQGATITTLLSENSELSTLYSAVRLANLQFVLEGVGPFTMFAPTNAAWQLLGPGVAASLMQLENTGFLTQVLQYHVCYGDTPSQQLQAGQVLSTFEGETLAVTTVTPFVVNLVPISRQDLQASNGLVHTIGKVFMPPNFVLPAPTMDIVELIQSESYFSIIQQAIRLAGLEPALREGPLTVLVPTNEAFSKLGSGVAESMLLPPNLDKLRQVLLHHVIAGRQDTTMLQAGTTLMTQSGGQMLVTQTDPFKVDSLSEGISTDVPATNGLLHVVDTVVFPRGFVYPDKSLLQLVQQSPALSTLAAALQASGLDSNLGGVTLFTLFAPTNDAFAALGIGVATSLLMPANKDKLYQLLRYHLLPGAFTRDEFTANAAVQTLEQSFLKISSVKPFVVGTSRVSTVDVPATNGVMHMLDSVLLPASFRFPDKDVVQLADSTASLNTFNELVSLAGLRGNFTGQGPYTVFAPTDAAFAVLGGETLQALRQVDMRETLQRVLKYHVISGRTDSTLLRYGRDIRTLEGASISITPWTELGWKGIAYAGLQPPVTLNVDVQVSTPNALATNGIVHLVNKVLVPPGVALAETVTNRPFPVITSSARRLAGLALWRLLWHLLA